MNRDYTHRLYSSYEGNYLVPMVSVGMHILRSCGQNLIRFYAERESLGSYAEHWNQRCSLLQYSILNIQYSKQYPLPCCITVIFTKFRKLFNQLFRKDRSFHTKPDTQRIHCTVSANPNSTFHITFK